MTPRRLTLALVGVGLVLLLHPHAAQAWTPGTHIYLGQTMLGDSHFARDFGVAASRGDALALRILDLTGR